MCRLNHRELNAMSSSIQLANSLVELLHDRGHHAELRGEIDHDCGTIEVFSLAQPEDIGDFLDQCGAHREIVDFFDHGRIRGATWGVRFLGAQLAVTAHHYAQAQLLEAA